MKMWEENDDDRATLNRPFIDDWRNASELSQTKQRKNVYFVIKILLSSTLRIDNVLLVKKECVYTV